MDAGYREIVTKKIVYFLPSPAPFGEVQKAITVSRHKYQELTGKECTWDNVPMVEAYDNEIWIWFEVPEESS
jgi:hypothetical protein